MEQHFLRNFRKRDNLARYTQIFGNVVPGISVPFYFPAGIFRIWVERFASRKFNIFRIFWKLSPKISVPFFAVSNFLKSAPEQAWPYCARKMLERCSLKLPKVAQKLLKSCSERQNVQNVEQQNVAPNSKNCSKVTEHNRDRPNPDIPEIVEFSKG